MLFTFNKEEFEQNMNSTKEVIVASLVKEEYLAAEAAKEFLENYSIILRKPGILGYFIDKIRGTKSDKYAFQVVRLVNTYDTEPEEESSHLKVVPLKKEKTDDTSETT